MSDALYRRAREIRERLLIRSWQYRQRNLAAGVWYRLRRVLVDAAELWVIPRDAADALVAAGVVPHPVGEELVPPKRLFLIDRETLGAIGDRRQIPVRLSVDFYAAADLALIPFGPDAGKTTG